MKRLYTLLFLILCNFALCARTPIAVIAKCGGLSECSQKPGDEWQIAKPGTLLTLKTRIRTGDDGFVVIVFIDDKSTLKVRPSTFLTLDGSFGKGVVHKNIGLSMGDVFNNVSRKKRTYEVETPTSVASVKGTQFWVSVSPVDSSTVYYGLEGIVSIAGENGDTSVLKEGDKVLSKSNSLKKMEMTDEEKKMLEDILKEMEKGIFDTPLKHQLIISNSLDSTSHSIDIVDNKPYKITAKDRRPYLFRKWIVVRGLATILNPLSDKSVLFLNGEGSTVKAVYAHEDSLSDSATVSEQRFTLKLLHDDNTIIDSTKMRYIKSGEKTVISAQPSLGHHFSHWEVVSGKAFIEEKDKATTTVHVQSDATLRAHSSKVERLQVDLQAKDGTKRSIVIEYHE